jgi:aquaporin Z
MSAYGATKAGVPVLVVVPFGFGLGLLAAIFAVGHVSGGHFNPAVTLGALLDRRITPVDAGAYMIAQVVGAVVASLFLLVISSQDAVSATRNTPGVGEGGAFLVEIVLTAVFLLVILTVTSRNNEQAPFAIALTLGVIHFAGVPLSGSSVNPARSLGPAIVGADLSSIWVYLIAPFVGAALGWAIYRYLGSGAEA